MSTSVLLISPQECDSIWYYIKWLLIHFEFIFVYDVRLYSNFILLHVAVQLPQHHLLKKLSLPHRIFLPLLFRLIEHKCRGLLLLRDKLQVQFSLEQLLLFFVAQSRPTLCDPSDGSTPAFPVHHCLPESAQTHVH